MFENFIEKLCEKEGLVDVGNQGIAQQSSYSYWSKPNDPQRAISVQQFDDFAFHTQKEPKPWWKINWDKLIRLQYIVINNRRRKPFDKIAMPLSVFITDENDRQICVYDGVLKFGSLPESMPLILPLKGEFLVKSVKVVLNDYNFLHLSNVFFLKDSQAKSLQEAEGKLIFLAARDDGFGERLRAILHAMVLAKYYNGQFYFDWPAFNNWSGGKIPLQGAHSVFEIEQTFDKDFIDSHRIDSKKLRTIKLVDIKEKIDYKSLVEYDGIFVNQGAMSFHGVFGDVKFSNKLENVNTDVDHIFSRFDKDAKVGAIHFRMGDIVYGAHRFRNLFYYKVVPIYILKVLIDKLKNDGYQIILFGQDKDFCSNMAEKYNIMYSGNFISDRNYDVLQKAFFDIALMSKCDKVIAMHSGFAELATLIGKAKKITKYHDYLSEQEIYDSFDEFKVGAFSFGDVNPLLASFTISHFLNEFGDKIDLDRRILLIRECVELDDVNPYYKLILAKYLYEANLSQDADMLVLNELGKKQEFSLNWLTQDRDWTGKTTLSKHINEFQKAVDKGSLVAALLVLLNQYYMKKTIDKLYFDKLLTQACDNVLGKEQLKSKLQELTK